MRRRRRVRALIVGSLAATFVVSATLILAVIVADDSMRLCRGEQGEAQLTGDVERRASSVLRQLNIALSSNVNSKLPVYIQWRSDAENGVIRPPDIVCRRTYILPGFLSFFFFLFFVSYSLSSLNGTQPCLATWSEVSVI